MGFSMNVCDTEEIKNEVIEAVKPEKEEVSVILKENMENAVSLKVPMVSDVKCAKNWYEAK